MLKNQNSLLHLGKIGEKGRKMADNYLERKYEAYLERKAEAEKARRAAWRKRMDAYRRKLAEEAAASAGKDTGK